MNAADQIRKQKKLLRQQILAKQKATDPAGWQKTDRKITDYLLSLPEYASAGTVFSFVGTGPEINTRPFLEQVLLDGKTLCVPLCIGKGVMEARRIYDPASLIQGFYGLWEPDPKYAPQISPEQIDLAVIPCVTCSHTGERLGHGGGYYDRYFARSPEIFSVMICREEVICENIPRQPHDLIFPVVVTEAGVFRT